MTENVIRCRLKWGDREFEIEGAVDVELKKKVDYLYEAFKSAVTEEPESGQVRRKPKSTKQGGGKKPPFYKTNIRRIIDEEPSWFVDKSKEDVTNKLKTEYSVPGANTTPVGTALIRLFKEGLLTRKDADGKWLYSVISLRKTSK